MTRVDRRPLAERPLVKLFHALNRVYARGFQHVTVQTPPTLPRTGPAVLVCNHISGLDPLILQGVLTRKIVWMMAKEYYDIPALTWAFKVIEAIPVDRGARDTSATRAALRALDRGEVLGVFPEGKIETTRSLLPFQTGVAMMAARAKVPVHPAYMDGTSRRQEMLASLLTPNEVRVRFGSAVRLCEHAGQKLDLDISTKLIQQSVESLKQSMAYDRQRA